MKIFKPLKRIASSFSRLCTKIKPYRSPSSLPPRRNPTQELCADVLILIFSHVNDDYKTLLSCILVNRQWCQAALPFYWSHPFNHLDARLLVRTFLGCLEGEERDMVFNMKGELRKDITRGHRRVIEKTCINYAQYVKELTMGTLYGAVQKWLKWEDGPHRRCKLSCCQTRRLHRPAVDDLHSRILMVCTPLCRLFMSPRACLRTLALDWGDMDSWTRYPSTLNFPGTSTCLSQLTSLSISYIYNWPIFKHLAKSAVNIENLEILGYSLFPAPSPEDEKDLALLVSKQSRLQRFKLFGHGTTPTATITAMAIQWKTLKSVEIIYVHFGGRGVQEGPSLAGLAQCVGLEELVIRNCTFANDGQLAPLANSKFPALRKLHFVESMYAWDKTMVSLIRNNSKYLEEVFFRPYSPEISSQQYDGERGKPFWTEIVQVVAEQCPDLLTLGVPIGLAEMSYLRVILCRPSCRLKSLSLFATSRRTGLEITPLWPDFGLLMPTTLRHLNFCMKMEDDAMKKFLSVTPAPLETLWFDQWLTVTGPVCLIIHEFLNRRQLGSRRAIGLKHGARAFLKYVV